MKNKNACQTFRFIINEGICGLSDKEALNHFLMARSLVFSLKEVRKFCQCSFHIVFYNGLFRIVRSVGQNRQCPERGYWGREKFILTNFIFCQKHYILFTQRKFFFTNKISLIFLLKIVSLYHTLHPNLWIKISSVLL